VDLADAGRLGYRRVTGACSQGEGWPVQTVVSDPILMLVLGDDIRSLGSPPDVSFHDGHNHQRQIGPTRDERTEVRPATVTQLRAVARALPAALAELLSSTAAAAAREATESDESLAALAEVRS